MSYNNNNNNNYNIQQQQQLLQQQQQIIQQQQQQLIQQQQQNEITGQNTSSEGTSNDSNEDIAHMKSKKTGSIKTLLTGKKKAKDNNINTRGALLSSRGGGGVLGKPNELVYGATYQHPTNHGDFVGQLGFDAFHPFLTTEEIQQGTSMRSNLKLSPKRSQSDGELSSIKTSVQQVQPPTWLQQHNQAQQSTEDTYFLNELQSLKQINSNTNRRLSVAVTNNHYQNNAMGKKNTTTTTPTTHIKKTNELLSNNNNKSSQFNIKNRNEAPVVIQEETAVNQTNQSKDTSPTPPPKLHASQSRIVNDSLEILGNTARSMNDWVKASSGTLLNLQNQMYDIQKEVVSREEIPALIKRLDVIESALKELIIVIKNNAENGKNHSGLLDNICVVQQQVEHRMKDLESKLEKMLNLGESNSRLLTKQIEDNKTTKLISSTQLTTSAPVRSNSINTPMSSDLQESYRKDLLKLNGNVESFNANLDRIAEVVKMMVVEIKVVTKEDMATKFLFNTIKAQNEKILKEQSETKDQNILILKQQTMIFELMKDMKEKTDKNHEEVQGLAKGNTVKIIAAAKNASDKVGFLIEPMKSISQNFECLVDDLESKFPGLIGDQENEEEEDENGDEEEED